MNSKFKKESRRIPGETFLMILVTFTGFFGILYLAKRGIIKSEILLIIANSRGFSGVLKRFGNVSEYVENQVNETLLSIAEFKNQIFSFFLNDWPLILMFTVPIVIMLWIVLYVRHLKNKPLIEKQIKEDLIRSILEKFEFIYKESTKEALYDKSGEPVIDEWGRVQFQSIDHYPNLSLSGLPKFILLRNVHPKINSKVNEFSHGFLRELKEKGLIPADQGEVEATGYPGELKISLYQEKVLKELELYRSTGWYESKKVNNIKRETFPKVRISDSEVVIDFKGINITEGVIHSGLEKFCKFHNVNLKNKFTYEGQIYFFKYQSNLNRAFEKGEDILSKFDNKTIHLEKENIVKSIDALVSLNVCTDAIEANELLKEFYGRIRDVQRIGPVENMNEIVTKIFGVNPLTTIDENTTLMTYLSLGENPGKTVKERLALLSNDPESGSNLFEELIIKPMRDHYAKTGKELAFLGELDDPNITLADEETQIFSELTATPHGLCAGQTRSGKTKSVLSFVFCHKYAYPKSEWIFADGKSSLDYDVFAERFSNYPVAKMGPENDPLVELANQVRRVYTINEDRKRKMEALAAKGISVSTYVEYNRYVSEEDKIHRLFFIIDEFKMFAAASGGKVEDLINEKGTIWQYLDALLREASSKGITIICASQRVQATDFPTPLRSNLQGFQLIHAVGRQDSNFLGLSGLVETLKTGSFVLSVAGVWCQDSGVNTLKCNLPYIGDEPHLILDRFFPEKNEHIPFNYDLIYNRGKEDDIGKIGVEGLYKYIKQVFVVREGLKVIEEYTPGHQYMTLFCSTEINKKRIKLAIGIVNAEEVFDETFYHKIQNERPHDFHEYYKCFFVRGSKINQSNLLDLEDRIVNTCFFSEIDFVRPLKRAISEYKNDSDVPIFKNLIAERYDNTLLSDDLSIEPPDEIHSILNIKELNRIKKIKDNVIKGELFENFCLTLEKHLGHDSITGREAVSQGELATFHTNDRNESGLDLLRWVNRREKRAVLIQCKNQPSKNLNSDSINKLIKTRELYERANQIKCEGLLLYSSGGLTRQAKQEAKLCGVAIVDYDKFKQILREIEEEAFNDETEELNDFDDL